MYYWLFNNKFYFFGNDVLLGYNNSNFNPLTNINKDIIVPMETLAMSINFDHDKFDLLSFRQRDSLGYSKL